MPYRSASGRLLRVQRHVWVPLQIQQAAISLLCAIGVLVLGALVFAGFPAFKAYTEIKANDSSILYFATT